MYCLHLTQRTQGTCPGHTACKWQSWDLNPGQLASEPQLSITVPFSERKNEQIKLGMKKQMDRQAKDQGSNTRQPGIMRLCSICGLCRNQPPAPSLRCLSHFPPGAIFQILVGAEGDAKTLAPSPLHFFICNHQNVPSLIIPPRQLTGQGASVP